MATSLICETVTARTMAELLAARDAARTDMVELRLDGVADVDVLAALRGRRTPVIVTCRPEWEGGRFTGSEEARRAILAQAIEAGAEFVDVEFRAGFTDLIARAPARIVLSMHEFDGVPRDLDDRVRAMRGVGAGTIKVAVAASRLTDTLRLLPIAREGNAVVIAMGDAGVPTRLLAGRFGSRWTYAGHAVAPGQIPAARMIGEFRVGRVAESTAVYGVVSTNAMHSISPVMHNAAFAAADLDAVYVPLKAADFEDFRVFADAIGIAGASITIPFKLDALRAAGQADALTRSVGAANTLRRRGSSWEATNTDVAGFLAPLEDAFARPLEGARASVLGAGGAARAVIVALQSRGAVVTVHARRREQASELTDTLGVNAGAWPPAAGSWDLLVNATPTGGATTRDESPMPGGRLDGRLVYDLTYGPGTSALLRDAAAAGCLTLDGLPMLIAQAERQFEWWTGVRPAAGVMRRAAAERLGAAGAVLAASDGTAVHGAP
jgi:3-dehydroquinate dehydratase/shikimate dehydrogenase